MFQITPLIKAVCSKVTPLSMEIWLKNSHLPSDPVSPVQITVFWKKSVQPTWFGEMGSKWKKMTANNLKIHIYALTIFNYTPSHTHTHLIHIVRKLFFSYYLNSNQCLCVPSTSFYRRLSSSPLFLTKIQESSPLAVLYLVSTWLWSCDDFQFFVLLQSILLHTNQGRHLQCYQYFSHHWYPQVKKREGQARDTRTVMDWGTQRGRHAH